MIRNLARNTFRASSVIVGVLLILLALFTVSARLGLPLLAAQKANIESLVSDYLNSPVEIGALSVRWQGFGPMLLAEQVSVQDTGEHSVTLDELLIDLNLAKSLLRGLPIINELSLVGARLAVEADVNGQFRLHGTGSNGLDVRSAAQTAESVASASQAGGIDIVGWLFNASKVALLDTQLTLIDAANDQTLVISELNVRAENDAQVHQVRVDALLPPSLGGRLEVGLDMIGQSSALSESEGSLYVAAETISFDGVMTLLRSLGVDAAQSVNLPGLDAEASMEIWGRWQDGQMISASGPVTIGQVRDTVTGNTLLDSARAQLRLIYSDQSIDVLATDMQANLGNSSVQIERLKASRMVDVPQLQSQADEDNEVNASRVPASTEDHRQSDKATWHFSGASSRVPADIILSLASFASSSFQPASERSKDKLTADGQINNLSFDISGNLERPIINASMDIDRLAFKGSQYLPSFGAISGELSMADSTGQLRLRAKSIPLSWPVASDVALELDAIETSIDIDIRDSDKVVFNANLQLSDDGIVGSTRAKVTLEPDLSPHLDLQSQFDLSDITAIKPWLPRKLMKPLAAQWLDSAITAGAAADGSLLFFGHLAEFPFEQGQGVFKGDVEIRDGELDYLSGWPRASAINGKLYLDGLSFVAVAENASLGQFNVSQTRVSIANLAVPTLILSGTASGGFQQIVDFGVEGPLTSILGPVIGDMSGSGTTQMDLALELSLYQRPAEGVQNQASSTWRPFSINGSLFLDNNDVTFGRAGLELIGATGAVSFSRQGIAINNLQGQLLNHNVLLSGETIGQGSGANTVLTITGVMEANDLLAHYGNPLDQFITGASQWRATITAPHSLQRVTEEGVRLSVSSDLVGSQLLLPVPFNKSNATPVDFTLSTAFRDGAAEQHWDAVYGDQLHARVTLVDQGLQLLDVQLGQGALADASESDAINGIRLQGSVPSLAADQWIETVTRYINSLPGSEQAAQPILPVLTDLTTDALILGRFDFGQATMRSETDETYLNMAFTNALLKGSLSYPREYWQKQTPVKADLELLDWSVIDALSEGGQSDDAATSVALDPTSLPPIEASVSLLRHDYLQVRDLSMRAQPNLSGLDITTLGFAYDTMRLVGQGYWYLQDPQNVNPELTGKHASRLNMVLQSDDFGEGFDEVGLEGIVSDAQGSISMQLSWPGALYKPEINRLDGEVTVSLESGSIVPLEPAAGRVIGLFALQALPRRLDLDFKDLTGEGLAFTSIAGSAVIEGGIAEVPLLQLTGPVGVVDITGSSDLNTRQFNQRVTVLPRVSAALPVIGAISAGASGGIGALIATGVLKALGVDFDRIGLRTYELTGDWSEPEFAPVPLELLRRKN